MDNSDLLEAQAVALGAALNTVYKRLILQIGLHPRRHVSLMGTQELVIHHVYRLKNGVSAVAQAVTDLNANVLSRKNCPASLLQQTVGHFESSVFTLVGGHHDVDAQRLQGADPYICGLLDRIYGHTLHEISVWLQRLVQTIAFPNDALQQLGHTETNPATLMFTLTLTPAPEMEILNAWINAQAAALTPKKKNRPHSTPRQRQGTGFLGTLMAVIIGVGIGNSLFGDDE